MGIMNSAKRVDRQQLFILPDIPCRHYLLSITKENNSISAFCLQPDNVTHRNELKADNGGDGKFLLRYLQRPLIMEKYLHLTGTVITVKFCTGLVQGNTQIVHVHGFQKIVYCGGPKGPHSIVVEGG